jgi:hypothetical protein
MKPTPGGFHKSWAQAAKRITPKTVKCKFRVKSKGTEHKLKDKCGMKQI